jgi:hypothetical protein
LASALPLYPVAHDGELSPPLHPFLNFFFRRDFGLRCDRDIRKALRAARAACEGGRSRRVRREGGIAVVRGKKRWWRFVTTQIRNASKSLTPGLNVLAALIRLGTTLLALWAAWRAQK